ncbi:NACHT, LRR and PYD domains-containing protein 3-like [Astyanax mexicanus]|uniref:NACHT, LRR and PYD domains-containing protein 3-like n=1 Tax=Astyanax mexicanus TaxID=7994 RepID=UPI0020CB653C|nr:NACHT, LRR and PYD domains-containing protein 3-like [Astyanax mexicanus]
MSYLYQTSPVQTTTIQNPTVPNELIQNTTAQSGATVNAPVLQSNEFHAPVTILIGADSGHGGRDRREEVMGTTTGASTTGDAAALRETEKEKLKRIIIDRYATLYEGTGKRGKHILLNKIYSELYVVEDWGGGVNTDHEVIQMEARPTTHASTDSKMKISEIFHGDFNIKKVLTMGIAGIGKTVSVQKFALDWAEGKSNTDIDFVFIIAFRELNLLKDEEYDLPGLLLHLYPQLKHLKEAGLFDDDCKCAFILDGLDELRKPLDFEQKKMSSITEKATVDVLVTSLITGALLESALVWVTSRPAAADQIPPEYIHRKTEVRGFITDQQKEEYFRKRIQDEEQTNRIISHIKKVKTLYIMCYIPVFCWITYTVLQELIKNKVKEIPKTLTQMYAHFLNIQMDTKGKKYDKTCQKDTKNLLESNRTELLKLAELAFKQLMKGNVMFYEEDLRESRIDVSYSEYSGIFTEIFKEECVLYQSKVYCFVHLSFQEFLAAVYVFHCYESGNLEELQCLIDCYRQWYNNVTLDNLLKGAVDRAVKSQNGHLDLFLRFLLGLSLQTNQRLLQGLLTFTQSSTEETTKYIKDLIEVQKYLSAERSVNLFLCLSEMKDQSLSGELQKYLHSEKNSEKELSLGQCSALAYMLLTSDEVLEELDLKKINTSDEGYSRLVPAVINCRKARLASCNLGIKMCDSLESVLTVENSFLIELDLSNNNLQDSGVELLSAGLKSSHCKLQILRFALCNLGVRMCETLGSVLMLESSFLKELDLSNNDLKDSGVELLSSGLKSSHCKLQILRLSGCMITEKGCSSLASALSLNLSHLKELDLTYNHPGESGEKLLSARLEDPHCSLETLRLEHGGEIRIKPGLKKYGCDFTLDPNTVNPRLSLSEENRRVEFREKLQSYPDHPERFDWCVQVLSRERVTGRCYWEAERIEGEAAVALSYKTISRKGFGSDCRFEENINSWMLYCSNYGYSVYHNNNRTALSTPPSYCRRVGVYVDCPCGTLSFYSVSSDTHSLTPSHTLTHLHTFNTTFTQPLYAGIGFYNYGSSVTLCKIE